jgi:site-specific DNA recombinase
MRQTLAYVRVSTEDQVEYSPDAQAKRCRDLARLRDLGPVTVLQDEGWSGKNLDRPAMRELITRVEADLVGCVVIWRLDRLSRDNGDVSWLVKLFNAHGVKVHSVNEGELDLTSASGKMQVGVNGVFAQYYRDQIVENTKMGQRQAAEKGRWQNHAPTGYDMVNGELVPNDAAPIVQRIFELRAQGRSFQQVADDVAMKYGTVRFIASNRAYLGLVKYSGEWYPGVHAPLVNERQFNAAQCGYTPGHRHGRHLLSGTVRCGLCGRVASIRYNDRGQGFFRCGGQGQRCTQPARSANGLERATVLGLGLLADDKDLQAAIRYQLTAHRRAEAPTRPSHKLAIATLDRKLQRILDLCVNEHIDGETYAVEHRRLTTQLLTLRQEVEEFDRAEKIRDEAVDKFDQVAEVLADFEAQRIWDAATPTERWTLVKNLVDSVCIYPDRLTVQVAGAPPFTVALDEVGLKKGGITVVSEARREYCNPF